MPEVRNGAGGYATRSADYLAMNLWPSRGLGLHGIEQKKSRADWLKELKDPAKAEAFFKYCDYWWLLITDVKIATAEEIPESWGLLLIKDDKVRTLKQAKKLEPIPLDRGIISSMLRRSFDGMIPESTLKEQIEARAKEMSERSYDNKRTVERLEKSLSELQETIRGFEAASGVRMNRWDHGKIGEAVRHVLNEDRVSLVDRLKRDAAGLKSLIQSYEAIQQELENTSNLQNQQQ